MVLVLLVVAGAVLAVVLMASRDGSSDDRPSPNDSATASPEPTLSLPSGLPGELPSHLPTELPTQLPSTLPTQLPSTLPTDLPSELPSGLPSALESLLSQAGEPGS